MEDLATAPQADDEVEAERRPGHRARFRTDPAVIAYLMGPLALLALLLLMHFGYVVRLSAWVWCVVFVAIPTCNLFVDRLYDRHLTPATLNLRVAVQVAAVTAVIYLTGWGPVLWGAYAFIALEVIAKCGSRAWMSVVVWSLLGMAIGEIGIWQGLAPHRAPVPPVHRASPPWGRSSSSS